MKLATFKTAALLKKNKKTTVNHLHRLLLYMVGKSCSAEIVPNNSNVAKHKYSKNYLWPDLLKNVQIHSYPTIFGKMSAGCLPRSSEISP